MLALPGHPARGPARRSGAAAHDAERALLVRREALGRTLLLG